MRALAGDPQLLSDMRDRAPLREHTLNDEGTTELIQTWTDNVKQENLLARET